MLSQKGLNTSSKNISNVNVEGYSRQSLETSGIPDVLTGQQAASTNGNITGTVRRFGDMFIQSQIRTEQSALKSSDTYHTMAGRIDSFIADPDTNLLTPMEGMFSSIQNIITDPGDSAARIDMLNNADTMANRIGMLNDQLSTLNDQVDSEITNHISEINTLAENLASLNIQIVDINNNPNAEPPNDLMDQRDTYLQKLSEIVNTNVINGDKGQINVFIGYGQSLVSAGSYSQLSLGPTGSNGTDQTIMLDDGVNPVDITSSIAGGQIGGLVKFNREVLDPTVNRLGQMAAGFALAFNAQQRQGLDLNGQSGVNVFTDYTAAANTTENWVPDLQKNTGSATLEVTFDDTQYKNLVPSNYSLVYQGDTGYTLTRLSDNKTYSTEDSSLTVAEDGSFSVDGLKINVVDKDKLEAGDSFYLKPFSRVADEFKLLTTDPAKLAAATTGADSGGVADNSNMIAIGNLQNMGILDGGNNSVHKAYTSLVADIGGKTRNADIDIKARQSFLSQLKDQRENIAGVNLDEEAANLLKYQQAYQAAANIIPIANSMFDALISAIR